MLSWERVETPYYGLGDMILGTLLYARAVGLLGVLLMDKVTKKIIHQRKGRHSQKNYNMIKILFAGVFTLMTTLGMANWSTGYR